MENPELAKRKLLKMSKLPHSFHKRDNTGRRTITKENEAIIMVT